MTREEIDKTILDLTYELPIADYEEISEVLSEILGCEKKFARARVNMFLDSQVWKGAFTGESHVPID